MEPNSLPTIFPEHVLVWNTSTSSSTDSSHSAPDESPDWTRSRAQRSTSTWAPKEEQHPLLAKLLEMEEEKGDMKHSEYTAHVLIQRQAREYAYAVEDALLLLKNGSKQILENVAYWRGPLTDVTTPASWLNFTSSNDSSDELELSQMGGMVVQMSHAVKRLQDKDALAFWTSDQREVIFKLFVALSKDLMKMKRKLARIRDCLGDRVRNVRRAAIKCECEISGNIIPTEIYVQWVQEDAKIYEENFNNAETSSNNGNNPNRSAKIRSALKKTAKTVAACLLYPEGVLSPSTRMSSSLSVNSDDSGSTHSHSTVMSAPPHMKVYEIRKDIQFLRKSPSIPFPDDDDSICDKSLESFVSRAIRGPGRNAGPEPIRQNPGESESSEDQGKQTPTAIELEEIWSAKPSRKYLDLIAKNMLPPKKFPTNEYVFDQQESRIKEAHLVAADEEDSSPVRSNRGQDRKILSESMRREIGVIKKLDQDSHDILTEAIWGVREVERGWLAPASRNGSGSKRKELFQLLDFIIDTAKLTQNPSFSCRIYPEDMHEIKSVLDPVLKELTNTYMAIYLLHNVVQLDGQYLKELVRAFPRGNLIVRDWLSEHSIHPDEELQDMEEHLQWESTQHLEVDVDDLFA